MTGGASTCCSSVWRSAGMLLGMLQHTSSLLPADSELRSAVRQQELQEARPVFCKPL